jgi:hypothetical protein
LCFDLRPGNLVKVDRLSHTFAPEISLDSVSAIHLPIFKKMSVGFRIVRRTVHIALNQLTCSRDVQFLEWRVEMAGCSTCMSPADLEDLQEPLPREI